ncbi:hypothetical protein JZ751_023154 [Albula glossodonta]|uniref:Uncharacterized protein n=1 Tax=Albula glossodonta TaxID=121402 RepID=A0A8T2PEX9_9TELE|nr:hypothetical protein JZ751_023154 [Albula glossodonta]
MQIEPVESLILQKERVEEREEGGRDMEMREQRGGERHKARDRERERWTGAVNSGGCIARPSAALASSQAGKSSGVKGSSTWGGWMTRPGVTDPAIFCRQIKINRSLAWITSTSSAGQTSPINIVWTDGGIRPLALRTTWLEWGCCGVVVEGRGVGTYCSLLSFILSASISPPPLSTSFFSRANGDTGCIGLSWLVSAYLKGVSMSLVSLARGSPMAASVTCRRTLSRLRANETVRQSEQACSALNTPFDFGHGAIPSSLLTTSPIHPHSPSPSLAQDIPPSHLPFPHTLQSGLSLAMDCWIVHPVNSDTVKMVSCNSTLEGWIQTAPSVLLHKCLPLTHGCVSSTPADQLVSRELLERRWPCQRTRRRHWCQNMLEMAPIADCNLIAMETAPNVRIELLPNSVPVSC